MLITLLINILVIKLIKYYICVYGFIKITFALATKQI